METIEEKYQRLRPQISNGCIGFMSKNAFLSHAIRTADKSSNSHVFSIYEVVLGDRVRLCVIDANPGGVKNAFLSDRIKACDNFTIVKPLCSQEVINDALNDAFDRAEKGIKYGYWSGFKEWLNRMFGWNLKITHTDKRNICSEYTRLQMIRQDMVLPKFLTLSEPFPEDGLRYRNELTTEILK